ncbi:hypothetical protein OPQ81_011101 [Rhizoctonia solani]|nr:hypothetical protein OPQ81_011101 [Rhizoctonia solani]
MHDALSTRARTSGYKYYSALQQPTKPGFCADVDDRYRELMWTYRVFLYLLQLQRSGHKFPLHPDIDAHPGDQAVDCFACPRPGFDFEWAEVPLEERIWFRFWACFNGNSRSVRKNKRVDPGDICLSDNLAYFPHKKTYKEWTQAVKTPKPKSKPSCDHHKVGQQISVRWAGLDVTGVGAFSCARHTCILPRGMVDFYQGELFIYSVYALGALLWYINQRRGGCVPLGLTYDVMCHWVVNFWTRAESLPPSIAIPKDLDLVAAVPKWHLVGHEREFYVRWSLNHMQHVGRIDGEGPERFWSHINQHSGSTSEQSPAVRTDTVNNIIRNWNEDKGFNMHKSIPTQYKRAKKMLAQQKEAFEDLTEHLPAAEIKRWEEEPIQPVQGPDKKWTSPFMDPIFDGGFYETVKGERQKEVPTSRVAGRRPGATKWLSDGIEIEHSIRNFNEEAKELGNAPAPQRANTLNAKRLALRDRIEAHRKRRELYMDGVEEPDRPRVLVFFEEDAEEETFDLAMPSSYSHDMIETA